MKTCRILLFLLLVSCGFPQETLDNYWDDGSWLPRADGTVEVSEERFGRWIGLLAELPRPEAARRIRALFRRAEVSPEGTRLLGELCEKYLYSPESPWRDDECYLAALECMIATPHTDDYCKLRPRYQYDMARRNRPGHPAADFAFTDRRDAAGRLSRIEAPLTLLIFVDPDCRDCRKLLRRLRRNGWIRAAEQLAGLQVVAIYSSPEERRDRWSEYASSLPGRWIAGYDEGARLHYEGLYDLRTLPSLYLLDAGKRVLCKGETKPGPVTKRLRREIFRRKKSRPQHE